METVGEIGLGADLDRLAQLAALRAHFSVYHEQRDVVLVLLQRADDQRQRLLFFALDEQCLDVQQLQLSQRASIASFSRQKLPRFLDASTSLQRLLQLDANSGKTHKIRRIGVAGVVLAVVAEQQSVGVEAVLPTLVVPAQAARI